jgi:hypothetical protein
MAPLFAAANSACAAHCVWFVLHTCCTPYDVHCQHNVPAVQRVSYAHVPWHAVNVYCCLVVLFSNIVLAASTARDVRGACLQLQASLPAWQAAYGLAAMVGLH